jgi:hypothetical protein
MSCVIEDKKNFGRSTCNRLPNLPSGMITTIDSLVIPKATLDDQDLLLAFMNEKILLKQAWYWPGFASFENISEEVIYEDTPLAYLPVRDGNYRFRFGIAENICIHKAMYSHRALNAGRVILIDKENQWLLSEKTNGDGIGFGIQVLHSEKFLFNDGGVTSKSPILLALRNNKELDKSGILVPLDLYDTLYRIVDTELDVQSIADDEIVVKVQADCDKTPVLGLVTADFIFKDADGDLQTVTATSDGEGTYTLAGTGFVDGTLTLRPPSTLTAKAYEAETVDIEIPS